MRAQLHAVNIYGVTTLYKMLVKSISGTCDGCMFGIGTEGENVFAMQGIALVISGSTDIVCDANLLTSLD